MSERILKGVLHNAAENVILITISDKVKVEALKKIYNILLDDEIKNLIIYKKALFNSDFETSILFKHACN